MKKLGLALLLFLVPTLVAFGGDNVVHIGIVADVHAHDTNSPVEGKIMDNYAERIDALVTAVNAWPADGVIQLGDFVNGAFVMGAPLGDPTRIAAILEAAIEGLAGLDCPIYHVLGNHDMYDLSKPEVLGAFGLERGYYSFDLGGFHVVILDAEYNPDGSDYDHVFMRTKGFIPTWEFEWLEADLAGTDLPTIVCVHQPLDVDFESLAGGPPIVNHLDVQRALVDSGVVVAVLQGHDHENRHALIEGIHYITFTAMVGHTVPTEPSYALMTLDPEARTITIEGAGLQESYDLSF